MTTSTASLQNQIVRTISQIQCEDIRRIREQRETNRQNISLPTTVRPADSSVWIDAISRDISSIGIGLISSEQIEEGCRGELEMQLSNSTTTIPAQCLWCKPFGQAFFLSGWKFGY